MSHANLSHRRTHNILLISRLLNQREGASPFTLVNDSLEQPAKPLLKEYLRRAALSKGHILYLAFETVQAPEHVDIFLPCWDKTPIQILETVSSAIAKFNKRCLLIIDSLSSLCIRSLKPEMNFNLTAFLMSLLQPPRGAQSIVSMVAVHHLDMPLAANTLPHSPSPPTLLAYLATTIITLHSLSALLAEREAQAKSLSAPLFGLLEQKNGVLVGLRLHENRLSVGERGLVMQLEHRRKSGRGVLEWYFLPERAPGMSITGPAFREHVLLLDDHPRLKKVGQSIQESEEDLAGMTFRLGLTERQRLERDGVVLPYFDAQKADGAGDGGRILYDMGEEDDFDEEEDEI